MFLGLNDFGIIAAYVLSILSTLLCIVYGIVNWNKGGEEDPVQMQEESQWEASQNKIDEDL
ncbi:MAG: symporter small accessory protein [Anaerofustis sp.]